MSEGLHEGAPVLLMDEPTSALDGETEDSMCHSFFQDVRSSLKVGLPKEAVASTLSRLASRGRAVLASQLRACHLAQDAEQSAA